MIAACRVDDIVVLAAYVDHARISVRSSGGLASLGTEEEHPRFFRLPLMAKR